MNLQSSFTYDNFGRRTLRILQLNNTVFSLLKCSRSFMNMYTSKIIFRKILLSFLLVFSATAFSEENNPCLHNWGEIQYECSVSPKVSGNGDVTIRTIGISMAEVKLGLRNTGIQHGQILHFDAAERIKRRIFIEKSNKMSAFSVLDT